MILMDVMDNLADYIRELIKEYRTNQKQGYLPITVCAGYPPPRTSSDEKESYIYCWVTKFHDTEDRYSWAEVEIGFSICDMDSNEGWRTLCNVMEHVRQGILKKRTLNGRNRLILPVTGELVDLQPTPQWQGRIIASYTIAQPVEEDIPL